MEPEPWEVIPFLIFLAVTAAGWLIVMLRGGELAESIYVIAAAIAWIIFIFADGYYLHRQHHPKKKDKNTSK